jgi:hypothetical protein
MRGKARAKAMGTPRTRATRLLASSNLAFGSDFLQKSELFCDDINDFTGGR